MKKNIHPEYNDQITVTCSCGFNIVTGSTLPAINVEICSNCHPFYTGKQKLVDTARRVDKFKARVAKGEAKAAALAGKKKAVRKKNTKKVPLQQLKDKK